MAQPQPPRPSPELAALWRARLATARASYDVAVAEFRRLSAEYHEHAAPHADSGFGLRRALAVERDARRRYAEVLQIFTNLIVNGKFPPED